MTKKVLACDITTASGMRELEELKNRKDVRILNEKEYFGLSGSEDGPTIVLFRSIDYAEKGRDVLLSDAAYVMPIC